MTRRWRWAGADMTEDELQDAILDLLERFGWTVTHHRRSDLALTQGTPGEPDIRGIRDGQALWIECKTHAGRLSDSQASWLLQLSQVPDAVVRVLRPDGLTPLMDELRRLAGRLTPGDPQLASELRRWQLHAMV